MKREGSCLLMFVLLSTLVTFFCLGIWHSTVSMYDAMLQKQNHEQNKHFVEGILRLGVDLCCNNFDRLVDQANLNKPHLIFDVPFTSQQKFYDEGKLLCKAVTKKNNLYCLKLTAQILCKKKPIIKATCTVSKKNDENDPEKSVYKVNKWCLHNDGA